jgi:protein-tyrosine-phosphatase
LLVRSKQSTSNEALGALFSRHQAIARLPLKKWEEELRKNLDVIQIMTMANQENPEELSRQIKKAVRDIELELRYLQTTPPNP